MEPQILKLGKKWEKVRFCIKCGKLQKGYSCDVWDTYGMQWKTISKTMQPIFQLIVDNSIEIEDLKKEIELIKKDAKDLKSHFNFSGEEVKKINVKGNNIDISTSGS